MKTNLGPTKLTGWKMLVVATMLMLAAVTVNAQHHHGPPPPPPNFDSILVAHWDSVLAHHPHDTIPLPPLPPVHRDTFHFPPHDTMRPHPIDSFHNVPGCHRDTTLPGGGRHPGGHDTIPLPHPFPPFPPDTGSTGGGHHDTIPIPPFPPFPPDTTTHGGGHHDTIPTPPPFPPFPPDTGWTGGGIPPFPPDTTRPHHKDLVISATDNTPASISIFPNPVVSNSTMRIQNTSNTVTFRLYDMSGRIAREIMNLSNGDMNFSKENLTPGVYIYEMIDGNTIASTGKILVQ